MPYLYRAGVSLTQHHNADQRRGRPVHPSKPRRGQRRNLCGETQASRARKRESEPGVIRSTMGGPTKWFTHNATIGIHVELDMAKRFLGTRNGEEVARVGPKVDCRENFDPLERVVIMQKGRATGLLCCHHWWDRN